MQLSWKTTGLFLPNAHMQQLLPSKDIASLSQGLNAVKPKLAWAVKCLCLRPQPVFKDIAVLRFQNKEMTDHVTPSKEAQEASKAALAPT